jgi:two-component system OmpR family response regulator
LERPDGRPVRVLIVDDEAMMSEMVSFALRSEGWETFAAANGAAALAVARSQMPDAVILDVMLPDMSGLDLLQKMRDMNPNLPVLLLTARDAVEDRVAGFRAGGDDYVTKPFSIEEVVLRVRSLLRRAGVTVAAGGAQIAVGDLVLDEQSHEVTRSGVPISLTSTEFKLLRFLMINSRCVVSKSQILDQVWSYGFDARSNLVGLYISYLRKKVDDGRDPMIHTLRGSGYILKPGH